MGNTNDGTNHYEGALLEEIRSDVKGVAEAVSLLGVKINGIDKRLIRVEKIVEPIPAMIAILTEHSGQLSDHERRITIIEKA